MSEQNGNIVIKCDGGNLVRALGATDAFQSKYESFPSGLILGMGTHLFLLNENLTSAGYDHLTSMINVNVLKTEDNVIIELSQPEIKVKH